MLTLIDTSGISVPPTDALPAGRPASWTGLALQWLRNDALTWVLIQRFSPPHTEPVLLFGTRHDCSDVLAGGRSYAPGHFIEYAVAQQTTGGHWQFHRLVQHRSVTYSASAERDDVKPAASVRRYNPLSLRNSPKWKTSEANWPTTEGKPMLFVGQATLFETPLTRDYLAYGVNVYLFSDSDQARVFKIVTQDTRTADAQRALSRRGQASWIDEHQAAPALTPRSPAIG